VWRRTQRTLRTAATVKGIGLHTGAETIVRLLPVEPDTGVVFVRTDLPDEPQVPATFAYVTSEGRRSLLRNGPAEVHTTEHFLAALHGLGVDNLEVRMTGPELPGGDGSALIFVDAIREAGVVDQKVPRKAFAVEEPIHVREGESLLAALPEERGLHISYTLSYAGFPPQFVDVRVAPDVFAETIAPARTFVLESEARELARSGLGRGATYENTVVVGDDGKVPGGLRFPDEMGRHKVLDLLGDLFLANADLQAHVVATRSGHGLNQMLVRRLTQVMRERENRGLLPRETGLDIREISRILPHRYPFLMIDRVIEIEGYKRAVGIKNVTINEPYFQGHWPGQPIMPGVLILEAMAQLAGVLLLRKLENTGKMPVLWSIDKVKIRRSVIPGDQLRLECESLKSRAKVGQVYGRALVGDQLAAEAEFLFTLVDT
jgi:UDP-3-O-[3-hydroxymyristoyl] N-acetylglucosamine deacetylase/3-hydroxyacyl-[acyl-carrier-protein] dehydratase